MYSKVREKALGVILRDIQDNNHPILVSQKLSARFKPEKMDCFHDGSRLLREVHDWHQLLRSSVRRTDPLTEQVLDLIDHKVLIKEPEKRIRLPDLCADLEQLVMCAKKAARDREMAEGQEMRKSIERTMKLLKTIDKE